MILYGDPSDQESMAALLARLEESLATADRDSLEACRVRLILAGGMEQAVEDDLPEHAALCRDLTDAAARNFVEVWRGGAAESALFAAVLARIPRDEAILTIKLPEGFAFYGLYPEAYAEAARRWLEGRPRGNVTVVGVRSIGTSLSAVVAATLQAEGWEAERTTVRPTGPPFAREAHLEALRADHVLIVDEGPGLSGSSMAAVAEGTCRAGAAREQIVFFPGHGGEPGKEASPGIRAWWRDTLRVAVKTEELRWDGLSLEETLLARTEGGARIEDLSEGRWRKVVYANPEEWPAVATAFERHKIRVVRHDGSALLWKFVGLMVPGTVLGFSPAPWIEGRPLSRKDATPDLLAQLGRHIASTAGPPLPAEDARSARERLREMLRVNVEKAGLAPIEERPNEGSDPLGAGDYRTAPWEWRRLPDGAIVKAGQIAPTGDHTIVGRQPWTWDLAGAMVEWGLNDATSLLTGQEPDDLPFYRAAYAAFRMGQCVTFAGPDEEGERLAQAATFYRAALESQRS